MYTCMWLATTSTEIFGLQLMGMFCHANENQGTQGTGRYALAVKKNDGAVVGQYRVWARFEVHKQQHHNNHSELHKLHLYNVQLTLPDCNKHL